MERVRAFINTAVTAEEDVLSSPDRASEWLLRHELLDAAEEIGAADLVFLSDWRRALRDVALANNGGAQTAAELAWGDMRDRAARLPLRLLVGQTPEQTSIVPAGTSAQRVAGRLAGYLYDGVKAGTFRRLKACPEQTCLYAFYDHSKNASATWCSMAVCGNRAKARRRREREKGDQGGFEGWQPSA